jgi:hypothetical protein
MIIISYVYIKLYMFVLLYRVNYVFYVMVTNNSI